MRSEGSVEGALALQKLSPIKEEKGRKMRKTRETQVLVLLLSVREQNMISLIVNIVEGRVIHLPNTREGQTNYVRSIRSWGIIKESARATLNKRL